MSSFMSRAGELHQYMHDYQQQHFSEWVRSLEDELKDDWSGLAMKLTGKLMEVNPQDLSAEDFTYGDTKKASGNVADLCSWVKSMILYTWISKEVKPKIAKLKAAESKLSVAMAKLESAQKELDECNADLARMQATFDEATAKKQAIEADAYATQRRMDSANKLIGALGGEYTRWKADSEAFADEIRRMAWPTPTCRRRCARGPRSTSSTAAIWPVSTSRSRRCNGRSCGRSRRGWPGRGSPPSPPRRGRSWRWCSPAPSARPPASLASAPPT